MSDILNLIDKMGGMEDSIKDREFISPIFHSDMVATSIGGIVHKFAVPKRDAGWYKLRPLNLDKARVVGEADFTEIEEYLKKLPRIRLVLTLREDDIYYGVPPKVNKYGFSPSELLPVYLYDDSVLDYDVAVCRFDGVNFWFESVDMNNDPAKAEYLRDAMEKLIEPKKIHMSGLTFEEKLSYTVRQAVDKKIAEERKRRAEELRMASIKTDVEHAGGEFVRSVERRDHFSVTYKVDGEQFTSHIAKDAAHKVITAGICLSGGDRAFDLKSLITVVREARQENIVHRYHMD